MVTKISGREHDIQIHDIHQHEIASRAKQHGVRSLPAVVVDGKLAGRCAGRGTDEQALRTHCDNVMPCNGREIGQ